MARVMKVQKSEAIAHFQYEGRLIKDEPFGNGHINDTFLLTFELNKMGRMKAILQRMNNSIFVIVKLNDVTVGYLYGLMDNRAIRVMQNCFKMEYAFYSPLFRGTYDFLIKQIQNESKNVMQIDFTRGDEPYKYKLGGVEMQLHNYIIKDGKIEL